MSSIPGYSMILAASTTLILSLIFMFLSTQSKQKHLILWGLSCLIYALMFTLDFCNFQLSIPANIYMLLRQFFALWGSFLFLCGTNIFFQRKSDLRFFIITIITSLVLVLSVFSSMLYGLSFIFIIIICSGLLFYSGCVFISYSWTQILPEKYMASFLIFLWGIFLNHYQYSTAFLSLAVLTYFISILIVNALMLVLLIVYFKKTSFLDNKNSERFKTLVENSSDIMFLFNYDSGSFEYVSPGIFNLIGVSDTELYLNHDSFYRYIKIEGSSPLLENIFNQRIAVAGNGILYMMADDKIISWCEIHYIPIRDNTNTVTVVEGILRDITQKRLLEENVKENEQAKKEFLENIQHEIKTPITLIQGYSESIIENIIPEESINMYLHIINQKAQLLTTLVNDLTQVSEFESQNMEFSFYEYNAFELFNELAESFTAQISQGDRIPKTELNISDNATIIADQNRLQQVISNLVNNAIRHTPSGSEIVFSGKMVFTKDNESDETFAIPDGFLLLSISDRGTGFNEDDLNMVFKRNYSEGHIINPTEINDSDSELKNFGLGLHISQTIIRNHSGYISAYNNEEHGATVTFTLPFYLN